MSISDKVKRLLYFDSGGFCQNPSCNCRLTELFDSGRVTSFDELAHIIGQKEGGPRGKQDKPLSERDGYENIILLCPTCHTIIDKNPSEFPVDSLIKWKQEHSGKIASCFAVPVCKDKGELGVRVHSLLRENRRIFNTYGPHCPEKNNLLTDAVKMWDYRCIDTIIPNNRKIVQLLIANDYLLSEEERSITDQFIIHVEAFEKNKLYDDKTAYTPTFPIEMNDILR